MRHPFKSRRIARFIANEDGATLMEYALIGALVTVIIAIAVLALTGRKY